MRLKIIVLVLAIAIVAIALLVTASAWKPVDGINGAILSLVFPHDTFWAKGYSDKGFQAVQLGMSRDEVYKLLGPPQNMWIPLYLADERIGSALLNAHVVAGY